MREWPFWPYGNTFIALNVPQMENTLFERDRKCHNIYVGGWCHWLQLHMCRECGECRLPLFHKQQIQQVGSSHNKVLHLSVGVFYVFLNIEIHTFWNTDDKYKHTKSNWWDWSNVSTLSSNTLSPLLLCSDNQQHVISIASIIPTQNYFQLTHTQINKSLIYTNIQLTNTQIIVVFRTIPTQNHYQQMTMH